MNEFESIGQRIVWARAAKGWSQSQLAERAGVASTQIARWENGRATPRPETAFKLALLLDVSPRWLERGEGPINAHEYPDDAEPGTREVIASLSGEEVRILRKYAEANGRSLGEEIEAIAEAFLARWEALEPPPGWVKLKVPDELMHRVEEAAEVSGRSAADEIVERLRGSFSAKSPAELALTLERIGREQYKLLELIKQYQEESEPKSPPRRR
ncbi:helix-turn-helix domain-containing protein [Burkholderia plantarii]|uniref:helix-turn-helix domain-containing protein n=1 Tax=Burkholderia plantarii TaxID=41899 RepID=UPI00272D17FA|nr:helix-turn-helix domain-containing protein [Burkholderia plantarii]WLE58367.1 helix-turn-helix domain-containing protein [Burkholderia plantarii]